MSKRQRKNKAAKQREHFRNFHRTRKPSKSIDDLTDYEAEQIWAEAVQMYKAKSSALEERLTPEELEMVNKLDPFLKKLKKRIERIAAKKMTNPVKYSLS